MSVNENSNASFFKLDKAAAAWHFGEINQPHSKAEYAAMWSREKKRYNLQAYRDPKSGGYNRTDFLPARYEVSRPFTEPLIEIDAETGGDKWAWRDSQFAAATANARYEIKKFESIFDDSVRDTLQLRDVRNRNYRKDLRVAARWYPQWTLDANRSANVAFFILNALFELSKKGPAFLKYGHMLALEADFTRTVDDASASHSQEFITKLGGLEAIAKQRKELQVERVADYKFPTAFKWTFETGIDEDDPQQLADGEAPGADLLTQAAFGALALAYDGVGIGEAEIDRFQGPKVQTNPYGIITGWEWLNPDTGNADWDKFVEASNIDNTAQTDCFVGFRWATPFDEAERKRGYCDATKTNYDGTTRAAPGRIACNNALRDVFKLLHEEADYDNKNYYTLYGAWIEEDKTVSSSGSDTKYPKMTTWLFEPVQNSFGFDEEPNKHDFFLLYLEARVRSRRGAQALGVIAKAAKGSGASKAWAKWIGDFLYEEAITAQEDTTPTHLEPDLVDGKVTLRQKFGKAGPNPVIDKSKGTTQPQEGHWMRLGRLAGQDDAAAKKAEGRDYWITGFSPAAGTCSAWILGDSGKHNEVWFSTASTVEEESNRALYAGRPPYQLFSSLPKDSVIEDKDLDRDDVPWNGPSVGGGRGGDDYGDYSDYSYGGGYSDYGYGDSYGYSGYSNYDYSY